LQECIEPPLSVLDNRVAAYIKLGDLQNALRDGKQMIRAAKTDARGYLRVGQVLQKMGNDDQALDVYSLGMKNLPVSNQDRQVQFLIRLVFRRGLIMPRCFKACTRSSLRSAPPQRLLTRFSRYRLSWRKWFFAI
jgi:tetratricopeptide (TPR) repeat protein